MKSIFPVSLLLLIGLANNVFAQDLIKKIPSNSNFIVTLNNEAILKNLEMDEINRLLNKWGFFEELTRKSDEDNVVTKLEDLGINWNSKAYIYGEMTDSLQFVGALIPLIDVRKFEAVVGQTDEILMVNGLKTIYSSDRAMRTSWDNNTLYVLGGIKMDSYFDNPEVKTRYSLPEANYDDSASESLDWYAVPLDSTAVEVEASEDALDAVEDAEVYIDTVDYQIETDMNNSTGLYYPHYDDENDYAAVDSALEAEEYQDDYYLKYRQISDQRDSIIDGLIHQWVNSKMESVIGQNNGVLSQFKSFRNLDDKTLIDVQVKNINSIYSALLPLDAFYGLGITSRPQMDMGVEEISGQLKVDNHVLKFSGDATFDAEIAKYYKEIYNRKPNRKFLPYLEKDILGFLSLNFNTEAYIKYFPVIADRYYGPLLGSRAEVAKLGLTILDIMLDEKAISKVMKGDNLLLINGVNQQEVEYTDYEYDDDYNYKEIKKTKMETVPDFLWMFSSDDTRIFEKLIQIGLNEGEILENNGVYSVNKDSKSGIEIHILIKDGIVFLGNQFDKLNNIKNNTHRPVGYKPFQRIVKQNKGAFVVNTQRIPDIVDELNIPVDRWLASSLERLREYGNFYMYSPSIKGRTAKWELGIEMPKSNGNALRFLFESLDSIISE